MTLTADQGFPGMGMQRGVGAAPLRMRSKYQVEVINQLACLDLDGNTVDYRLPDANLDVNEASCIVAPNRVARISPDSRHSSFQFHDGASS